MDQNASKITSCLSKSFQGHLMSTQQAPWSHPGLCVQFGGTQLWPASGRDRFNAKSENYAELEIILSRESILSRKIIPSRKLSKVGKLS